MEISRSSGLDQCGICFEGYVSYNSPKSVQLKCKHVFHWICLTDWTDSGKNSCPLCRKEVYDVAWKTNYTASEVDFGNLLSHETSPSLKEFFQMKQNTAEFWNPGYRQDHLIKDFFKLKQEIRDEVARQQAAFRLQRNSEEGKIYCIALLVFAVIVIHSHTMNTPNKTPKTIK